MCARVADLVLIETKGKSPSVGRRTASTPWTCRPELSPWASLPMFAGRKCSQSWMSWPLAEEAASAAAARTCKITPTYSHASACANKEGWIVFACTAHQYFGKLSGTLMHTAHGHRPDWVAGVLGADVLCQHDLRLILKRLHLKRVLQASYVWNSQVIEVLRYCSYSKFIIIYPVCCCCMLQNLSLRECQRDCRVSRLAYTARACGIDIAYLVETMPRLWGKQTRRRRLETPWTCWRSPVAVWRQSSPAPPCRSVRSVRFLEPAVAMIPLGRSSE